ncbi:MAG: hypothetical protein Q9199_001690 [Rusavskia elegans]
MHHHLTLLAALSSLISAIPLQVPGHDFAFVPYPGPIPYSNPSHGGDWPQGTTSRYNGGLSTDSTTLSTMSKCLQDYGSGRFYDTWDGNRCGGMGWYKGTANGKVDVYKCYQSCAPYLMYDGAKQGAAEYLCDYRTGLKGHCWMGYHRLPANESGVIEQTDSVPINDTKMAVRMEALESAKMS